MSLPLPHPRRRAVAPDRSPVSGRSAHGLGARRHLPPGAARQWLAATGSLTARLRGLGAVSVHKLRQGHQALLPLERQLLGIAHGHVRVVLLRVDGQPAVWARSVTPLGATRGAWRAMRGLGNRPLAELLFTDRAVRRAPLCARRLSRHAPGSAALHRDWRHALHSPPETAPTPHWMRWSVFHRRAQPLLVQEAFAPWVLTRPLPAQRA
jgi:chorismate lyase